MTGKVCTRGRGGQCTNYSYLHNQVCCRAKIGGRKSNRHPSSNEEIKIKSCQCKPIGTSLAGGGDGGVSVRHSILIFIFMSSHYELVIPTLTTTDGEFVFGERVHTKPLSSKYPKEEFRMPINLARHPTVVEISAGRVRSFDCVK